MAGFAKFDPYAFLESEKRTAANKLRTLAGLATLAAPTPQNENQDVGQSSTTADHYQHGANRKSECAPAKVAKAAKVTSSVHAFEGARRRKSAQPSSNTTAVRHARGLRRWRSSIRVARPMTYRLSGGCASSTTAERSSTTAGQLVQRRWAGGRSTCSAATASSRMPASTARACSGCSTAKSFSPSPRTWRPSSRLAAAASPSEDDPRGSAPA
jgi:hypothetical protein